MHRLNDVTVLLSRLEGPVNLGFIARAMANTGFKKLAYTGEILKNHEEALKYAVHADNILAESLHAENFEKLTFPDIIIGFTPRTLMNGQSLHFDDLKDYTYSCLSKGLSVGLLFGNEASGLDNSEISACAKTVSLPTSENYVSMNLAQAVLVSLWELRSVSGGKNDIPEYAGRKSKDILLKKLKEYLELIEFLNEQNPDHIWQEIRQLIESKDLTVRQAEILISVVGKSIIRYNHLKKLSNR